MAKGWKDTVKGWFIVDESAQEDAPPPIVGKKPSMPASQDSAADDIIRRYSGGGGSTAPKGAPPRMPAADKSPARSPSGEAPPDFLGGGASAPEVGPGGAVDFPSVFRKAGIKEEEIDRVNKALALLDQLPAETPQGVKKQIVETSLKAFGVPIESIIETAVAEIEALHGCIEGGTAATQKLLDESQARIEDLEQQIAQVREVMSSRQAEQKSLESAARGTGLKVQQILEFFGQDKVGQVVRESPRLTEPGKK